MLHLTFRSAVQAGCTEAWPTWGKRPLQERVSIIEPKKVVEEKGAQYNCSLQPATTCPQCCRGFKRQPRGKESKSHPGKFISLFKIVILYL